MGAAGGAFFCKNGHMTDCWGHHEYSEFDDGRVDPKCEFCGESATHFIAHGFEDSDFDQSEMPQVVRKERLQSSEDGTWEEVEVFDCSKTPTYGKNVKQPTADGDTVSSPAVTCPKCKYVMSGPFNQCPGCGFDMQGDGDVES